MVHGQLVGLEVGLIGGLMVDGLAVGMEVGLMLAFWLMV
jgi:tetrahydromethanopterin S-methyltransferase subunit F